MLSREQLKERKTFIGATEAAAILGLVQKPSRADIWHRKVSDEPSESSPNERMYWGSTLEDVIGTEYARRTGADIVKPEKTIRHPKFEFIGATLDFRHRENPIVVECKNVASDQTGKWGDPGSDEVPLHILLQVQQQLLVTGFKQADIAVLFGGNDFQIYRVIANDDIQEAILSAESEFWFKHVVTGVPPKPQNGEDVKLLFPQDSGRVTYACERTLDDWLALVKVSERIKELTSVKEDLESKIKVAMESAAELRDGQDRRLATWKSQVSNRLDQSALKADHPGLVDTYTVPVKSRVFRLSIPKELKQL